MQAGWLDGRVFILTLIAAPKGTAHRSELAALKPLVVPTGCSPFFSDSGVIPMQAAGVRDDAERMALTP
ncbi:MAG: hypothetical protein AAF773_22525 [Cyanobacteria bacterium P01_D01_bin.115]